MTPCRSARSDDVVRVRQAVRATGGRRRIQPGGSDQDHHRRQRDRAQYGRLRRRRHAAHRGAAQRPAARRAPDLHRPGPGIPDIATGHDGRLHQRRAASASASAAPSGWSNEFDITSSPGQGTEVTWRVGNDMITAVADASQVAEARRLAVRLRAPTRLAGNPRGPGRDRGHRTGDQPAEAWRRRRDPAPTRSTTATARGWKCWRWIAAPAWPTSNAASADGYSTAGSPGNGLGAVMRLSDQVRI